MTTFEALSSRDAVLERSFWQLAFEHYWQQADTGLLTRGQAVEAIENVIAFNVPPEVAALDGLRRVL